jgi:Flp pilus assembly protein TadD
VVGAIDDFTEALEIAPNDWVPLFHRWQAFVALGDTSGADRDMARGLKLNPDVFGKTYYERSMATHGGVI